MGKKKRLRFAFDVDRDWWDLIRDEAKKAGMDVPSYLRMIAYRETLRRKKDPPSGAGIVD